MAAQNIFTVFGVKCRRNRLISASYMTSVRCVLLCINWRIVIPHLAQCILTSNICQKNSMIMSPILSRTGISLFTRLCLAKAIKRLKCKFALNRCTTMRNLGQRHTGNIRKAPRARCPPMKKRLFGYVSCWHGRRILPIPVRLQTKCAAKYLMTECMYLRRKARWWICRPVLHLWILLMQFTVMSGIVVSVQKCPDVLCLLPTSYKWAIRQILLPRKTQIRVATG